MLTLFKQIFTWWNHQTLGTRLHTFSKGKFVGKDENGNKYYESKNGRRWVIYNGEVDSTKIPNEWFSWIHFTKNKIEKVEEIYNKKLVPKSISNLGLDLYHCFSQVKDALSELDRYTQGYVDNYLFDGKEMIKEAKRIQIRMSSEKKNKNF